MSTDPRMRDALAWLREGNKKEARIILKDLLKQTRDSADLWYLWAASLDDEAEQIQALRRALELSPNHERALKSLAKIESKQTALTVVKKPVEPEPPEGSASYFAHKAMRIVEQVQSTIQEHSATSTQLSLDLPQLKSFLKQLTQAQKELRFTKREIGLQVKAIRAKYTQRRSDAQAGAHAMGAAIGIISAFAGKGMSRGRGYGGSLSASRKESLRREQERELQPYLTVSSSIDEMLITYDKLKLDLQSGIEILKQQAAEDKARTGKSVSK